MHLTAQDDCLLLHHLSPQPYTHIYDDRLQWGCKCYLLPRLFEIAIHTLAQAACHLKDFGTDVQGAMPKRRQSNPSIWSPAERQQFAKNVVLLSLLNGVPNKPAKYDLQEYPNGTAVNRGGGSAATIFPIEHDCRLAEALAFMTATSNDRHAIMAVCVEQHDMAPGLTFRIAANTGDLSEVAQGLVKMGSVLERVAKKGSCSQKARNFD